MENIKLSLQEFGEEPIQGSLNGTFQDCLDYLNWSINVYAGRGNMDVAQKGKAFSDAIKTLKERYGWQISTHYLKQFCEKQKHKNLHIQYMLRMADMKTTPIKANFKGGIVNGRRCIVPKIFDMLISKQEWEGKEIRAKEVWENANAEWDAERREIERQKLNIQKLQIVSNLAEEEVNLEELEELAPDIKAQDREMVRKF